MLEEEAPQVCFHVKATLEREILQSWWANLLIFFSPPHLHLDLVLIIYTSHSKKEVVDEICRKPSVKFLSGWWNHTATVKQELVCSDHFADQRCVSSGSPIKLSEGICGPSQKGEKKCQDEKMKETYCPKCFQNVLLVSVRWSVEGWLTLRLSGLDQDFCIEFGSFKRQEKVYRVSNW